MATIDISVSKFSNTSLNGSRTIQLSRQKCIKFAIGVGTSHYSASFRKTKTAVALASYRAMAVRCVFDFGSKGKPLEPYRDYRRLEATEKVNLSYWIGMTMAGVAVDEVLGVTKTTHASHMGRKITHSNPKTKSLADLVGFENKRYHIIEAKGRQTKPSTILRNAWKTQAQTISKVNGVAVSTNSYSVGLIDSPVVIELEDPPANDPNGMDLKMSPESFGVGYYEPYIDFLRIGETFQVNVRNVHFLFVQSR